MAKKLIWTICLMIAFAPLQSKAQNCPSTEGKQFRSSCHITLEGGPDCIVKAVCPGRKEGWPSLLVNEFHLNTCPKDKDILNCNGILKCGSCG